MAHDGTIVVVDSPPILPFTDALVLAGHVDATVLLVRANSTSMDQAEAAVELLSQIEVPVLGSILNGARTDKHDPYGYYRFHAPDAPRRLSARPTVEGTETGVAVAATSRVPALQSIQPAGPPDGTREVAPGSQPADQRSASSTQHQRNAPPLARRSPPSWRRLFRARRSR